MSRAQGQGTMRGKQRGDRRGGWRGGGSGQPVWAGGTGCVIFPKPGLLLPPSSCTARRARKARSAPFSVGRSVGLSACLCSRPRRLARPLVVPGTLALCLSTSCAPPCGRGGRLRCTAAALPQAVQSARQAPLRRPCPVCSQPRQSFPLCSPNMQDTGGRSAAPLS